MFSGKWRIRIALVTVVLAAVAVVPVLAGSAVVGSVAGSMNATIGGQTLMPNTTIFSGDSLQVKDGAAVVAVGSGSRLVFGRETVASFLREASEVTVLLGQGNVSLYQAPTGVAVRVKVGTVSIAPAGGFKTLGEVAMVNGVVVVTAKEGKLRVEGNGPAAEVVKGKTVTLTAKPGRSPQGGAAGAGAGTAGMSASTALQVGSVAAGATSSVLSGVAISRAGDARDAASASNSTAAQAAQAASEAKTSADAATASADNVQNTICTSTISEFFPACSTM